VSKPTAAATTMTATLVLNVFDVITGLLLP
jgi:hypothetical protein